MPQTINYHQFNTSVPSCIYQTALPEKLQQEEPVKAEYKDTKKVCPLKDEGEPFWLFSTLPYYTILLVYVFIYYVIEYWRLPEVAAIVLFPLLTLGDIIFPEDWRNPTKAQSKKLASDAYDIFFKIPLYVSVVADWIFFFWAVNHFSQQPFHLTYFGTGLTVAGFMFSVNFTVAHELFHKHDSLGKFVGTLTMTKMLYTHFFIEHQYGHHKHVATPEDPATSRLGETLYQFLPKSIVGQYISAWNIEKRRLLEIEECSTHWHPKNRMIWYTLGYPAFLALMCWIFGVAGMLVAFCLALFAILFLEITNYIEHYGLERKEISPGEYERVTTKHSWNAPHRITNYILFKLQRHSDHHENAYKPYQTLASYDESPLLPNGYIFCAIMSMYPIFWFKVMNTWAIAHKKGVKISEEEKLSSLRWRNIFYIVYFVSFALLGGAAWMLH